MHLLILPSRNLVRRVFLITDEKIELEEVKTLPPGHTARGGLEQGPQAARSPLPVVWGPVWWEWETQEDKSLEAGEINAEPEPSCGVQWGPQR